MSIIKTKSELDNIRKAGKILSETARLLLKNAQIGISLKFLDELARKKIIGLGGKPSFLGYKPYGAQKPYPATICSSINDVIVHCVPTDYLLKSGDVLKIDIGVSYKGYHADAAWTIGVDKISKLAQKLIRTTETALELGIKAAIAGNTLGNIGHAIETYVKKNNFSVVEGLTGHGVGRQLHEEPSVYNFGTPGRGLELLPGMTLAIEPMVSAGSSRIKQLADDSYAIIDGSLSAHFEHTIIITNGKPEIVTAL